MRRAAYLLWMAGAVGAVAAAPLGVGLAQTAAPVAECDLNLQDARHWLEPNFAGAGQGAAAHSPSKPYRAFTANSANRGQ